MDLARATQPTAQEPTATPAPVPTPAPAPVQFPSYSRDSGYEEPPSSPRFLIFAIVAVVAAAIAGLIQSGKLPFLPHAASTSPTAAGAAQSHPSLLHPTAAVAVPLPKPGAFTVTTISLVPPRFAIINGKSRVEGDSIDAPGVTGWKIAHIVDGAVLIQNGSTSAWLPETLPGIKPLNDQLHALN